MEILQSAPGVSQIRMYDKRDHMLETLKQYRRYPHIETRLSKKCLYATLHCQLRRFAIRCSEIHFFQVAVAKLMTDIVRHGYAKERLRSKLQNFRKTFFLNLSKSRLLRECMTRLYVTSIIGGWSLREFGDVSKGKAKHPGIIDC